MSQNSRRHLRARQLRAWYSLAGGSLALVRSALPIYTHTRVGAGACTWCNPCGAPAILYSLHGEGYIQHHCHSFSISIRRACTWGNTSHLSPPWIAALHCICTVSHTHRIQISHATFLGVVSLSRGSVSLSPSLARPTRQACHSPLQRHATSAITRCQSTAFALLCC